MASTSSLNRAILLIFAHFRFRPQPDFRPNLHSHYSPLTFQEARHICKGNRMLQLLGKETTMSFIAKNAIFKAGQPGLMLKILPLAALMSLPAGSALAADARDNVSLSFDVYAGSLRIFKISMGMDIGAADYAIHTNIKSKGVASLFAKTKINMSAAGRNAKTIVPLNFSTNAKSKGKKRSVRMSWTGKGTHKVKRNFKLNAYKAKSLAKAVRPGMLDPLSYLMKMVARSTKQPCGGTARVYNGRQVAEYRYTLQGMSNFNRSTGGVYRGKAYKCLLKYRTVAGLSAEKQKAQDKKPPSSFTIWFAPVAGKGRNLLIPIAANGEVSGKAFTMRLSQGSVSGKPISKRVLATN